MDKIVLNEAIVTKLEIVALDLKYYININASISQAINNERNIVFMIMDDEDVEELIEIRKKLKKLSYKLKNKLKENEL